MSEPEIARRCVSCGATARQHAMFCPQCGNPLPQTATTTVAEVADTVIDTAPAPTQPLDPVVHKQIHKPAEDRSRGRTLRVAIDQAAYDPSLRFILVGAALFLFFLVLLILSKVLG